MKILIQESYAIVHHLKNGYYVTFAKYFGDLQSATIIAATIGVGLSKIGFRDGGLMRQEDVPLTHEEMKYKIELDEDETIEDNGEEYTCPSCDLQFLVVAPQS